MKLNFVYIIFNMVSVLGYAQNTYFKSIGGGFSLPANYLTTNLFDNKLYAFGAIQKIQNTGLNIVGATSWNGIKWDTVSHKLKDSIDYIVNVDNNLYGVGYVLKKLNPTTLQWETIARPNKSIYKTFSRVAKYKNGIVIYGNQDSINGQKVSQIVYYDGNTFTSLGTTNFTGNFMMQEYNGELYIGGVFVEYNYNLVNLAKWDGTTWKWLNWCSGGSFSQVSSFKIYQNKLFIGGGFHKNLGAKGDNLLSWDGDTLIDYDLQSNNIDFVWDMCEYRNKLILTGLMDAPIPKSNYLFTGFLSFDGYDMCSYVPHYNFMQQHRLGFIQVYNDTLHFTSYRTLSPTDTVNFVAKYVGDFVPLHTVNIIPRPIEFGFNIYPNPFNDAIILQIPSSYQLSNTTINIVNSLGQLVLSQIPNSYNITLNTSSLSSGMYYLTIQDGSHKKTEKIIKQ